MDQNQFISRLGRSLDARNAPSECSPIRLVFETKYKALIYSALDGGGGIYSEIEKAREKHFFPQFKEKSLADIFAELDHFKTRFVDGDQNQLSPADLDDHHGKKVAILKVPAFFKTEIGKQKASEFVSDLFSRSEAKSLVEEILSISQFSSEHVSFATHYKGLGVPYIVGSDSNTFRSLIGISHELGHCVWDRTFFSKDTYLARSLSEAYAHILEEETVMHCLSQKKMTSELGQWKNYQMAMDRLNFYFFDLEYSEVTMSENGDEPLISKPMRIFRSSYFIMPGLQPTYLVASLVRIFWRRSRLGLHPTQIVQLMRDPTQFLETIGLSPLVEFLS